MISTAFLAGLFIHFYTWLHDSSYNQESRLLELRALEMLAAFSISMAALGIFCLAIVNIAPGIEAMKAVIIITLAMTAGTAVLRLIRNKELIRSSLNLLYLTRTQLIALYGGMGILSVFALSIASPHNWDVNAYNLARVPAMAIANTSLLDLSTTNDPRQALFPVLHDILYLPDLILGNTRGLQLLGVIELFASTVCILAITRLVLNYCKINEYRTASLAISLSILTLFNCSQQVLQAINSKNDLAVALLLCVSLYSALLLFSEKLNAESKLFAVATFLLASILGYGSKSYGILCFAPAPIILAYLFIKSKSIRDNIWIKAPSLWNILVKQRKYLRSSLTLLAALIILVISITQACLSKEIWINSGFDLTPYGDFWTNTTGSISERFSISILNIQRNFIQIVLFPFTSTKIYNPLVNHQVDTSFLNSLVPNYLLEKYGARDSFQLMYGSNLDTAHPLLMAVIVFVIGTINAIALFIGNKKRYISLIALIAISTGNFIAISSILYYNNYLSRYMGVVWLPLIPAASIGCSLFIKNINRGLNQNNQKNTSYFNAIQKQKKWRFLDFLYISSIYLPILATLSISQYITRQEGLSQDQDYYYKRYLMGESKLTEQQANLLIEKLKKDKQEIRIICSTPTKQVLMPLIYAIQGDYSKRGEVIFRYGLDCTDEEFDGRTKINQNKLQPIKLP